MQVNHTQSSSSFLQQTGSSRWGQEGTVEDTKANSAREVAAVTESEKASQAELAAIFAEMLENVRDGRPADKNKEEHQRDAGLNAFKEQGDGKAAPGESESHAGMNRIRTTLGAAGFEREDIDAYIQAMKMPETNGTSRDLTDLQQEQQEELLEEQKQEQQIENRLTDSQQPSASMTYQRNEVLDEIEQMKQALPTVSIG